jgi:retinol dehydrogenase-10
MALRFAGLKCRLVLWDINTAGNEETALAIRELGQEAYTYTVDLSSRQDIYKAADQVQLSSVKRKTHLYIVVSIVNRLRYCSQLLKGTF